MIMIWEAYLTDQATSLNYSCNPQSYLLAETIIIMNILQRTETDTDKKKVSLLMIILSGPSSSSYPLSLSLPEEGGVKNKCLMITGIGARKLWMLCAIHPIMFRNLQKTNVSCSIIIACFPSLTKCLYDVQLPGTRSTKNCRNKFASFEEHAHLTGNFSINTYGLHHSE